MGQTASAFPFDIGSEVRTPCFINKTYWKLYDGKSKSDGSAVSIFALEKREQGEHKLLAAQNALQRLKSLRHPSILRFIEGVDLPDTVYIVTEHVEPLDLSSEEFQSTDAIALGLRNVVTAIGFLNNDCKMVHANLCQSSVFVNDAGDWKLGGFDILFPHSELAPEVTRQNADVSPPQYRCPELRERQWSIIMKSEPWSVDSWSLACFMHAVFSGGGFRNENQLKNVNIIDAQLRPTYGRLLSTAARGRLNPNEVLSSSFFETPVVQSVDFLENLPMKSDVEKHSFFQSFSKHLDSYPLRCLKFKVLPELSKALEFGSASSLFNSVFTALLKIGSKLTPDEYKSVLMPSITKLYAINERAVRIGLLKNLPQYAPHLTPKSVNEEIWPKVVSGFSDTSSVLREVTLKSVPAFAKHLAPAIVNGALLGFMAKLQTDQEPAIRTNTTFCLAKVGAHMNDATRKKVLSSGFSRALKDPFAPARLAGLTCFAHSVGYFEPDVIARRLLPTVSPFCVDSDVEVRNAAIKCLSVFTNRLKQASDAMKAAMEANGDSTEHTASQSSTMLSSAGNWMLSSLKSKVYGGGDDTANKSTSSASSTTTTTTKMNSASNGKRIGNIDRSKFTTRKSESDTHEKTAKTASGGDSWDDDFFGDFDDNTKSKSKNPPVVVALELGSSGTKKTPKERRSSRRKAKKTIVTPVAQEDSNVGSFGDWDSFEVTTQHKEKQASASNNNSDEWGDLLNFDADDVSTKAKSKPVAKSKSKAHPPSRKTSSSSQSKTSRTPSKSKDPFAGLEDDWTVDNKSTSKKVARSSHVTLTPSKGKAKATNDDDDWASFLNS